jgi:hypothetical protein
LDLVDKSLPRFQEVAFRIMACDFPIEDFPIMDMPSMPMPARFGHLLCVALAFHAFSGTQAIAQEDGGIFPPSRSAGPSEGGGDVTRSGEDDPALDEVSESSSEGSDASLSGAVLALETTSPPPEFRLEPLASRFSNFGGTSFEEQRVSLAENLIGPEPRDEMQKRDRIETVLRFAALHLHHGLWREAKSIAGVATEKASSLEDATERDRILAEAERIRAVSIVADPLILEPVSALDDISAHMGKWPEGQALRMAAMAREGKAEAMDEGLHDASIKIASISDALLVSIGPHLLEAALRRRDVEATNFLSTVIPWSESEIDIAKTWLEGLSAELSGDDRAAVTLYEAAAEGDDVWAQRARLRAVQLGLENGFIEEEEARERLRIARLSWRGDALAMQVLRIAADLEISQSEEVEAIGILEDMRLRHGALLDMEAYHAEKLDIISRYYGEDMTLAQLLEGHSRLSIQFSGQVDFLPHAEFAGDQFLSGGAVQMAVDEYARIVSAYERLSRSRRVSSSERAEFRAESKRVRIKAAEALLASGRAEDALAMLPETTPEDDIDARVNGLRAESLTMMEAFEAVLATGSNASDPDHLRLLASANANLERWEAAREGWISAIDAAITAGRSVEASDIHAFALASNRSGMIETDISRLSELAAIDGVARVDIMDRMADAFTRPDPLTTSDLTKGRDRASRTVIAVSQKSEASHMD